MNATEARDRAVAIADATPTLTIVPDTNVIGAIARVMRELPAIGKNSQASPQQGGYAYRGIEAITSEAQGLFGKYGVVFVPRVISHSTNDLTVNGKPWTDTILEVEYTIYGPGGLEDHITVGPLIAIGRDNSDKGANKALTQSFKYALLQVLCISDRKDDGDGSTHEADARSDVDPLADESMKALADLIRSIDDADQLTLKSHLRGRFGEPQHMTLDQINAAIDVAAGWPDTAGDA
jgi:hypothetical protein